MLRSPRDLVERVLLLLALLAACAPREPVRPAPAPPATLDGAWRVVRFRCLAHPLHHEAGILAAVLVGGVVTIEVAGDRLVERISGKEPSAGIVSRRGAGFEVSYPPRAARGFFAGARGRPDGAGGWIVSASGCESRLRRPAEASALPALCLSADARVLQRRRACERDERALDPKSWQLRSSPR
jgi:hypothetical protein